MREREERALILLSPTPGYAVHPHSLCLCVRRQLETRLGSLESKEKERQSGL